MAQQITMTFSQYGQEVRGQIDEALRRYADYGEGCPKRLAEAIRHSLLAPGKRLRPILVLMACEACGCDRERAMPAACAVEMVHTYSLIHDDLPAMDDDDLRRGRPSCHAKFGEATAILAGDALLAQSFEIIARNVKPPDVAARCCAELGQAAGATQLVGGQADDLAAQFSTGGVSELQYIHARKTGALICVSLRLGGLIAQASDEQLAALNSYGLKVGLAFQITDDLLDLKGDEQSMGKRIGKDSDRGKLTFPSVLGVDESKQQADQLIDEACLAVACFGERASGLEALARFILERNQ